MGAIFVTKAILDLGPFLCASERTGILTAFNVFRTLENELGATFIHHLSGMPLINSLKR